jgi:hypothetical protein
VWLFLNYGEQRFLDAIGTLIGENSRHKQILFVIKLARMIVPMPDMIVKVYGNLLSRHFTNLYVEGDNTRPKERCWVYLNDNDIEFLRAVGKRLGEKSVGRTIHFIISFVKLAVPHIGEVVKIMGESLQDM